MALKLGINLGYWGIGPKGPEAVELVRTAEARGFDSVWVAESYGSDCVSVLAWLAAQTEKIKLGAAIMQVPARPPAAAAMAGATIDALSGGRFIFGFGPSGPQVSEGWYGVEYAKPWGRTREYIEIVREIIAREGPLEHDGKHYQLPLEGGTGQGKALKLNFHPVRNEIPVFVGAIGRKSVEMAAEICDGWIPIFFSADAFEETWGEHLEAGFAKGGRTREDLEISPSLSGRDRRRPRDGARRGQGGLLLYLGGMGSRETNFYVDLTHRFGFGEVADEVQSLYLDGKREEAYNAIPDELVDATSLIGDEAEVAARIERLAAAGVDRLICSPVHMDAGPARAHGRPPRRSRPASRHPPEPAHRSLPPARPASVGSPHGRGTGARRRLRGPSDRGRGRPGRDGRRLPRHAPGARPRRRPEGDLAGARSGRALPAPLYGRVADRGLDPPSQRRRDSSRGRGRRAAVRDHGPDRGRRPARAAADLRGPRPGAGGPDRRRGRGGARRRACDAG